MSIIIIFEPAINGSRVRSYEDTHCKPLLWKKRGDVKSTQQNVMKIDNNINELKTMIMQAELRRMRETRSREFDNPWERTP